MTARNYFWGRSGSEYQAVYPSLILSTILHIALAAAVLLAPGFKPNPRITPEAMSVSLVSLPDPGPPLRQAPKPAPTRITPEPPVPEKPAVVVAEPAPKPEPVQAAKAPAKREPEVKHSLKSKTFKTGKVVERAVKEIEKQVVENRPDAIKKAIDRIREKAEQKTGQEEKSEAIERAIARLRETVDENPDKAGGDAGTTSGPGGGQPGNRHFDETDLYKQEIKYRIQKNWAYSDQLAGNQSKMKTLLVIRIMPDGEIKDIWFEEKSGNPHLDDSAYRAVLKSNPLPPLPPGYNRSDFMLGMVFTPSGIQ
ncbi:MAG: cell envelope integrity protein TolA [Desulfobacterales bacterium]